MHSKGSHNIQQGTSTANNGGPNTRVHAAAPDSVITDPTFSLFKITEEAQHVSPGSKLNANMCQREITTLLVLLLENTTLTNLPVRGGLDKLQQRTNNGALL